MLKSILTMGLLLSSLTVAFAAETEADIAARQKFCSDRLSTEHSLQDLLKDRKNILSFTNQGGLGGGGVCWWHSRFTRNATYLVQFRPDLPAVSDAQAKQLVLDIRKGNKIVVVPGFKDLSQFSYYYGQEVQNKLEDWQKTDGLKNQQWVVGLAGSSTVSATKLASLMDELYASVSKGEIAYQKLQLPGITAHAWLVLGMEKTANGYKLQILDSNLTYTEEYTYVNGDTNFNYYHWDDKAFVPYLEKEREVRNLRKILTNECKDFIAAQETVVER